MADPPWKTPPQHPSGQYCAVISAPCARCVGPGPHLPSIWGTRLNSNAIATPQPPSPWPYLPVTAPQPTLHNARPSLNRRTPSLVPRHRAPPSVSPRHVARYFAVLRYVPRASLCARRHARDNAPLTTCPRELFLARTPVNAALTGVLPPKVSWTVIYFLVFRAPKPVAACL